MITWDDVIAIASELDVVDPDAQTIILEYANTAFNPAMFSAKALRLARIYLAAHLGTLSANGGDAIAGPVISETVGGISRTYALLDGGSGLSGSSYADMLKLLIRTSRARLPRVI